MHKLKKSVYRGYILIPTDSAKGKTMKRVKRSLFAWDYGVAGMKGQSTENF